MCSRHVHILPRIKAYSILLFPYLPARVRGGNNGEICRFSPHEAGGGTRDDNEVVSMAARLTDKQKKKIVADYLETESYNATAKINGVSKDTVKRIVLKCEGFAQKAQQKKKQNTLDMLAFMETRKEKMQEAIDLHLMALTDPEKIRDAGLSQIATSFGIIVDKATKNTASGNDSLNKLDGLLKEFKDAVKSETN